MSGPSWHAEAGALAETGFRPVSVSAKRAPGAGIAEVEMSPIGIDGLASLWGDSRMGLQWTVPFVLPPWLQAWTETLGRAAEPLLLHATFQGGAVGIAPLMVHDGSARFLGDPEVCDCFDCVVAPGFETAFFKALLIHLRDMGVAELVLGPVRADSALLAAVPTVAALLELESRIRRVGESFEIELPDSWEAFLGCLTGKQRHEVRRKMRRLREAGTVELRCASLPRDIDGAMDGFLQLFRKNRPDKAAFMQAPMEDFFRSLSKRLGGAGMLRLFSLDLGGRTVASAFCIDHGSRRYLYNNGYDEGYGRLSVSLLSKILSIQDAIRAGLAGYDFLRGAEVYKGRLGGREVALHEVRLNLRA